MKVTYLNHSGFLVENQYFNLIFDYVKGKIPSLNMNIPTYIFVTHGHNDHFNTQILESFKKYSNVTYILSKDIILNNIELENLHYMEPQQEMKLFYKEQDFMQINTLTSTDEGVAFLVKYKNTTIYHSGDLNRWVWPGESQEYNDEMAEKFTQQMQLLNHCDIDIAFFPLDPRQENEYAGGILEFIKATNTKIIFPMHFWGKPNIIKKFKTEYKNQFIGTEIIEIKKDGESYRISEKG